MNFLKEMDKKADEIIDKLGLRKKRVSAIIRTAGFVLLVYVIYKLWKLNMTEISEDSTEENDDET